jgi:phage tail sheath gpL-like
MTGIAQAKGCFGENSQLTRMIGTALSAYPSNRTFAVALSPSTGDGNASCEDLLVALKDEQYHVIACPYLNPEELERLEKFLAQRFRPDRQIEGFAFVGVKKTHADMITLLEGRNSPHVSLLCTHASATDPEIWAASVAATVCFHGAIDPARPFRTLEIQNVTAPPATARLTFSEREQLLEKGGSTYTVGIDGKARIEQLNSTYKKDASGEDSTSFTSVNTLLTLSYLRYSFRSYFGRKYPRHKLASDHIKTQAGQAIMTPSLAKAECIALFRQWEDLGLVQNIDQFKNDLNVELNNVNPCRLDFSLTPQLVNQLTIIGAQVSFLF